MLRTGFLVALVALTGLALAPAAPAVTTVTDYSYDADGALTAVSTQVNDNAPTTTYLTWDDFTPNAANPSTGTVTVGDGRLVGFGPSPGTADLTSRFTFDPRDRLLRYSGANGAETYDYDASGQMMSSSAGGDDLSFYYDASGNPAVTNIHQDSTDLTSAYLGNNRFLSDGAEQILLKPRKDVACTYHPANQTLQSYTYDAFGAQSRVPLQSTYDLRQNPFQYSGEYRDPLWGGIYLRARWYDPDLPVFISRDPAPHLNRYAYGNANPVMNSDPSGYGPGGLRRFLAGLNRGVGGHFARIFLAPLIGPLQIAAYPKQFWQSVKTDKGGIDVFLALGVASEGVGGALDFAFAGFTRLGVRYGLRFLSDTVIGVGSSITAGASRGFSHFDWNAFGQGIEYSLNPFLERGFTGLNVRTGFRLSGNDVANLFEDLRDAPGHTALVFRERTGVGSSTSTSLGGGAGFDKPFLQAAHWSIYHERLIAITKDDLFQNDVIDSGVRVSQQRFGRANFNRIKRWLASQKGKYEFVGKVDHFYAPTRREVFLSNPYNVRVVTNDTNFRNLRTRGGARTTYGAFTNNCQWHAYAVLRDMGLR